MSAYLFNIDETNKLCLNRPHESNRVYYSELNEWYTNNAFRSFSLKYVVEGTINYRIDRNRFDVTNDSYLIADKRDGVIASFKSVGPTKSVCIDINSGIISQAATVMAAKEDFDFENYLDNYFKCSLLCEKIYSCRDNAVGSKLSEIISSIHSPDQNPINNEWFLELTELIILQEKGNYLALNGIASVKNSTKIETLRRLRAGREYMDALFLTNPEIEEVAANCNMSEFHFFRCFKQAFGITPYRYLMKKRLEYSKLLLAKKKPPKQIADICGFADVQSYTKAFKREFGAAPVIFNKQYQTIH